MSYESCLKQLGYFRAISESAKQFNSIVFRVIVGVLASVPLEIVALVTTIEFFLNSILEIPFGKIADRKGRVPTAIVGLSLISFGLTCCYIALCIPQEPKLSYLLFIVHGISIGLAKPLVSGSIDAFYQDSLARIASTETDKKSLKNSFTTSQTYGKYLTSFAVLGSFALIYLCHISIGTHHSFVIGISLWILTILKVLKDYKAFGDSSEKQSTQTKTSELIKTFISNNKVSTSVLYNLSFYAFTVVIAGYFLISIGRELSVEADLLKLSVMASFMFGYAALGWILKSIVLPRIIEKFSTKSYVSVWYILLGLSSIFYYQAFANTDSVNIIVLLSLSFGAIFHVCVFAIHSVSMNMLLTEFEQKDYATVLSIQNILGFIWVGVYSAFISKFFDGAPTVSQAFITVAILSGFFFIFHLVMNKGEETE